MQKSLMLGLNEKNMQAVVHEFDLKDYYYPTLFPLRETNLLTWKMLEGQAGLKIAGDVIARGATIPRKTREALSRVQGDIPKITFSREMLEDELTEYDIAVALASGNPDLMELVRFWAEDTQTCWEGVANRIEWIALQQLSNGKVQFTQKNNQGIATAYDLDYGIPSGQKIKVDTTYAAGAGKFFTKDVPAALAQGKEIGSRYRFALMNPDTFAKVAQQTEVIDRTATFIQVKTSTQNIPNVEAVNSYLMGQSPIFGGLQIVLLDQYITTEVDGHRIGSNPFSDDKITYVESLNLGNTFWKRPIDLNLQGSAALKVMNGHTLIKKYSQESPVKEVTEGIANAFPAWNSAGRSVIQTLK